MSGRHFDSGEGEEVKEKKPSPLFSTTLNAGPLPESHESHEGRECLESRKYPKSLGSHECLESHEYPVSPVSPVSNGQGLDKQVGALVVFKRLAARNACTRHNPEKESFWQLLRDLRALEKGIGRELAIGEIIVPLDEWFRLSQPFLDPVKTRDDYLAECIAGIRKVRAPTGEGDTLNKALEAVSKLTVSELPTITGLPEIAESWRRLLALHAELSRRSTRKNKTYFLSYRDAAKAYNGLTPQHAYNITLAFDRLGLIKIIDKGQARASGGKAAEFQYLLPQTEKPGGTNDELPEIDL